MNRALEEEFILHRFYDLIKYKITLQDLSAYEISRIPLKYFLDTCKPKDIKMIWNKLPLRYKYFLDNLLPCEQHYTEEFEEDGTCCGRQIPSKKDCPKCQLETKRLEKFCCS